MVLKDNGRGTLPATTPCPPDDRIARSVTGAAKATFRSKSSQKLQNAGLVARLPAEATSQS